ncbi:MAG: hypothetical protein FD143_187 [Ignavibacteria bacterium]|nr:MAG: hypothetical protein FD143_187 [Ignavibacteria bacterium]
MEDLFSKFLELTKELKNQQVEYVLIGGMAINLHGFARNTEDNIEKLRTALFNVFHDEQLEEITINELEKYSVIRYGSEFGFFIDLITRIGEKFNYEDLRWNEMKIDDCVIRVADVETLYKLKEKTYREIDAMDLRFLQMKMKNKND